MPIAKRAASRRWLLATAAVLATALCFATPPAVEAQQQEVVRFALPTKTYYPTIVTETALRAGLFAKEGIKAELTVYRGGAEAFEAVAAGAADVSLGSAAIIAAGRKKGVNTKGFANAALGYFGWYLVVKSDSQIKDVKELEGKKVGITSAGSGSDLLAQWAMADKKVNFTRVPLGGGGLVPNLLSGNVDAIVLYSPLSFRMFKEKTGRQLIDFGAEVPPHATGIWLASDKMIAEKPQVVQKITNALLGAMELLRADRASAIKLISEINEIPAEISEAELDGNLLKLSTTGELKAEWVDKALEMAKLIGMTNLADAKDTYVTTFKGVPTKK